MHACDIITTYATVCCTYPRPEPSPTRALMMGKSEGTNCGWTFAMMPLRAIRSTRLLFRNLIAIACKLCAPRTHVTPIWDE